MNFLNHLLFKFTWKYIFFMARQLVFQQEEIEQGVDYYIDEFDISLKILWVYLLCCAKVGPLFAVILIRKLWFSRTENFNGEMIPYSTGRECEGKVIQILIALCQMKLLWELCQIGWRSLCYEVFVWRRTSSVRNLSEASGVGHVIPNYK